MLLIKAGSYVMRFFSKFIKTIGLSTGMWGLMGSSTLAMCIWFAPPGRIFEPADNMRVLLVKHDDNQQMVVQPEFNGDATDFALVMPFAVQPDITEAPEDIFAKLEDLTNPVVEFPEGDLFDGLASIEQSTEGAQPKVTVLEQRDVGDYTATTLEANDSQALLDWLAENGYETSDSKKDVLGQYIGEGQYFVALKVNLSNAELDANGQLKGRLKPVVFNDLGDSAVLPTRLMADQDATDNMNMVIYTLSNDQLYIPGADVQFARKLSSDDLAQANISDFGQQSDWLVRNAVEFDLSKIQQDLTLRVAPDPVIINGNGNSARINPDLNSSKTGIVENEFVEIRYSEEQPKDNTKTDNDNNSEDDSQTGFVLGALLVMSLLANAVLLALTTYLKNNKAN